MSKRLFILFSFIACVLISDACTSAIVSAKASASGRPLLWKHRDTGSESNFIDRVAPSGTDFGYVALFNAGDSLLAEAWMGVNDVDFAIMNTASYNLAPDTATYKDQEGALMSIALKRCRTVDDFQRLLEELPKPLGVQANFGVIDAEGNGAYFETNDYNFVKFDLADSDDGVLIRTNFSVSGNDTDGMGYIRYDNASYLLNEKIKTKSLTPQFFTENVSRSFYHSLIGHDVKNDNVRWIVDQDFIPRHISTASIVIEGVSPDGKKSVMWTALGYPPCAVVYPVTVGNIPNGLRPILKGFDSPVCRESIELKKKAFSILRGNGQKYIDMNFLRPQIERCHRQSIINYERKE